MARTLHEDFPRVGWSSGFSPNMSSFPNDNKIRISWDNISWCTISTWYSWWTFNGYTWRYIIYIPRIATTVSSFSISKVPRAIKKRETRTSPLWTRVSPGGAWVVLNFMDKALKHPGDASVTHDIHHQTWIKVMSYCLSGEIFSQVWNKRQYEELLFHDSLYCLLYRRYS